jgi:hypothetical protein
MNRIAGLPNSDSNRAFDMFLKARYLQERGNGLGTGALVRVTGSEGVAGRKQQCRDDSKDGLQIRAHDSFHPIDFGEA